MKSNNKVNSPTTSGFLSSENVSPLEYPEDRCLYTVSSIFDSNYRAEQFGRAMGRTHLWKENKKNKNRRSGGQGEVLIGSA